ncbi:MAG: hypothetical protein EHM47_17480 [Ignavibacteriales bacterium]|nr:MAG: hypothetical protein EHM47_17480 [Ignavibacteriales bacterium]
MKTKNLFWSYSGFPNDTLVIEHTLKYDDVDSIKALLNKYGEKNCQEVWEKTLIPDKRFRKLNFFLAKFIFKIAKDDHEVKEFLDTRGKTRGELIYELSNR